MTLYLENSIKLAKKNGTVSPTFLLGGTFFFLKKKTVEISQFPEYPGWGGTYF